MISVDYEIQRSTYIYSINKLYLCVYSYSIQQDMIYQPTYEEYFLLTNVHLE
jgi:hypothetical protein